MPEAPIDPCEHYVYALFREDGKTPFYIGMGKRNRWLQHETLSARRRNHKDHIICQILARGGSVPKQKLLEQLTKAEAIAIEIDLIYLVGRQPHGPLVNATKGGEGILGLSPEVMKRRSAKIAAANQRPDVRAKKSAKTKGIPRSPMSDAAKEKLRLANIGNRNWDKMSPETQAKARERLNRSRAKTHDSMRANGHWTRLRTDPEINARIIAGLRAAWLDPEKRAKRLAKIRDAAARKRAQKTLPQN